MAVRVMARGPIAPIENYIQPDPDYAFGPAKWAARGLQIESRIPQLPPNIEEVLKGPCPMWKGKTIEETFKLIYIPHFASHSNPLSYLQQHLCGELNMTKHRIYIAEGVLREHDRPAEQGEWVLVLTYEDGLLPGSRGLSWTEQQALVDDLRKQTGHDYQIPKVREALTCIAAIQAETGNPLYRLGTHPRCQETVNGYHVVARGCDETFALQIFSSLNEIPAIEPSRDQFGVGIVRKF